MRVTIVCPNEYIKVVRESAKEIVESHLALTTPLSVSGNLPATHWVCTCYLTNEGFIKLNELKKYSSIYFDAPKKVLKDLKLNIINE
jgi:hypothetical protein